MRIKPNTTEATTLPVGEAFPDDAPALPEAMTFPDAPVSLSSTVAPPPPGATAKPHEIRLHAANGTLMAEVKRGDQTVTKLALPLDASQVDEAEIDRLNDVFKTLDDDELSGLLSDLDAKLGNLTKLSHGHLHDPLVSKKRVHQRVDKDGHQASRALQTEKHARRAVFTAEAGGHLGAPGALAAGAAGLHQVSTAHAAEIAGHALHLAAETLHVGAGVLDLFMAAKAVEHSPWHAAFHAVRGAMGIGSLFVPALGVAVAIATVGKLAYDATSGLRARRALEQSSSRVAERLATLTAAPR